MLRGKVAPCSCVVDTDDDIRFWLGWAMPCHVNPIRHMYVDNWIHLLWSVASQINKAFSAVWPFSQQLSTYLHCTITGHGASLTSAWLVFGQVSEGRIVAALRDEVTAAEVRLEEERAAHTSTQRTAAAREQVADVFSGSSVHHQSQHGIAVDFMTQLSLSVHSLSARSFRGHEKSHHVAVCVGWQCMLQT